MNRSDSLIGQVEHVIEQLKQDPETTSLHGYGCELAAACRERMLELEHHDRRSAIRHAVAGATLTQVLRDRASQLPDWLLHQEELLCRMGGLWIHELLNESNSPVVETSEIASLGSQGVFLLSRLLEIHVSGHAWIANHLSEVQEIVGKSKPKHRSISLSKATVALTGNCQMQTLLQYLRTLYPGASFIHSPAIDLATEQEVKEFHKQISTAELLITHRIQPDYRNNIGLDSQTLRINMRPDSLILVLSHIHYEGHHPWIGYALDPDNRLAQLESVSPLGPYHDFLAMEAAHRGLQANDLLSRPLPITLAQSIRQHHRSSLDELRNREVDCNVEISPWIDENYQVQPIMHTINHPTSNLFEALLSKIINSIGTVSETDQSYLAHSEYLGDISIPILPWVREALNLREWASTWGLHHSRQPFSVADQLTASIDFYRQHPWIAEQNRLSAKYQFASQAIDQLFGLVPKSPVRSPSVAALINYYDDIDMLRWQISGGFFDHYDRIYIWDGPYKFLASIPFFDQQSPRLDQTDIGSEILKDPRVVYYYNEWSDEAEKRIAAYEAVQEDIVVLHDTDEFWINQENHYKRFWHSQYTVASNRIQNLYMSGLYCTSEDLTTPSIDTLPHRRLAFKRQLVSASDHLNFLWLVNVKQTYVDQTQVDPTPLAHTYHFTACRSLLGQQAKMSFYTSLYFTNQPFTWVITKLTELVTSGFLTNDQARQIFLLGDPGCGGVPNPGFNLFVHQRLDDAGIPETLCQNILAERGKIGYGSYLLLQGYPLFVMLEGPVNHIHISLGDTATITIQIWDYVFGQRAKESYLRKLTSIHSQFDLPPSPQNLHGRLVKVILEPDESLPPCVSVSISDS